MTIPQRTDRADQTNQSKFGVELRQHRRAAGLALRYLGQEVGFDFSYLAQVERGDRGGSAELARRCDAALHANGRLIRVFADRKSRPAVPELRGDLHRSNKAVEGSAGAGRTLP